MIKLNIKFEDGHRFTFWGEIVESMYGYISLKNIRDQADNIVTDYFRIYEPEITASKNMHIGDILRFEARVKVSEGIVRNLDNITRVKLIKKDIGDCFKN
ncbi:MAG: hypothetical protein MUC94_09050 [bacterium]|jgi:hypothetical protein|nr:hypothetical protein [bacterium]